MPDLKVKWRKVVGEFLVITISILLAFSLDAWWAGHLDRNKLSGELAALKVEFESGIEELNRARQVQERSVRFLTTWTQIMGPTESGHLPDSTIRSLGPVIETGTDLPNGMLSSLLSTGGLASLEDFHLKARLTAWPSKVADHAATEAHVSEAISKYRERSWELSPMFAIRAPQNFPVDYISKHEYRMDELRQDYQLENRVYHAILLSFIAMQENERLAIEASDIIQDIERYLSSY